MTRFLRLLRIYRRKTYAAVAIVTLLLICYVLFGSSVNNTPTIITRAIDWDDIEHAIFYREVNPRPYSLTVLLLHGHAFTSQVWQDLGTLEYLGSLGHRVLAVDLPGYGDSRKIEAPKALLERGQFVRDFIKRLQLQRPVLVSPSISGTFSLPFLFTSRYAKQLRGFVAVAPVATDKFETSAFQTLDVPTLIVYGERDMIVGISSLEKLKRIPGSVIHMIKGAGHACYVSNRNEFHKSLENFLERLKLE